MTFAIAKQQRGTKQAWLWFSKTSAVIGCPKTPVLVWTEIEFCARWGCPQVLRNNPYQSICSFARAASNKIHKRTHPIYFFVLRSLCSRFGVAMLRETSPSYKYINKTRVNKAICWTLLWYSFSPISNAYPKFQKDLNSPSHLATKSRSFTKALKAASAWLCKSTVTMRVAPAVLIQRNNNLGAMASPATNLRSCRAYSRPQHWCDNNNNNSSERNSRTCCCRRSSSSSSGSSSSSRSKSY